MTKSRPIPTVTKNHTKTQSRQNGLKPRGHQDQCPVILKPLELWPCLNPKLDLKAIGLFLLLLLFLNLHSVKLHNVLFLQENVKRNQRTMGMPKPLSSSRESRFYKYANANTPNLRNWEHTWLYVRTHQSIISHIFNFHSDFLITFFKSPAI